MAPPFPLQGKSSIRVLISFHLEKKKGLAFSLKSRLCVDADYLDGTLSVCLLITESSCPLGGGLRKKSPGPGETLRINRLQVNYAPYN